MASRHEEKTILEDKKIVIKRDMLQETSIGILKKLEDKSLLKAYLYLDEIGGTLETRIAVDKNGRKPESNKDVVKEYRNHLEASGKSENTVNDYQREVIKFLYYLKSNSMSLDDVSTSRIDLYLSGSRQKRKLSINSYSKLIIVIRSFLSYLYKNNFIYSDVSKDFEVPKRVDKEREYLTDSDIGSILNYLETRKERYKGENLRDKLIFYFGIRCGLRKSEIAKLNWEDVNFIESKIKILNSKGGKNRIVYFNQTLGYLIHEYEKTSGNSSGALVRGSFGKRITSCPMQRIIRRMYIESGTYREGLTIHSLRHTYAESLRKNKVDIKVIKTLLGHSSLATTDRYLHVSSSDLKDAAMD